MLTRARTAVCTFIAMQMSPDNSALQIDSGPAWSGYRDFTIDEIVQESETAKSFYLVPAKGEPLMPYLPGQHLPLRLAMRGRSQPLVRCYTLSDCYDGRRYRLTIKRETAPVGRPHIPAGLSSTWFHDELRVGDTIQAKMPAGKFHLDLDGSNPVTMIAGGIGVTPMMSMLNAASQLGVTREIHFFFALRHGGDHVFKERLQQLRAESPNFRMCVLYEQPRPEDRLQMDYDAVGRINPSLLKDSLATPRMEFYLCGPPGMMNAVSAALLEAGVEESRIKTESFGPSSLSFRAAVLDEHDEPRNSPPAVEVTFLRSGVTVPWSNESRTLLELAEASGVEIEFGCRYGDCATCSTPLVSGSVAYLHPTGAQSDPGTCLPCSCRPASSIVLDV